VSDDITILAYEKAMTSDRRTLPTLLSQLHFSRRGTGTT
jgi:hypothetical protein